MVQIKTAGGAGPDPASRTQSLGQLIARGSLLPMISNEALLDLVMGQGSHGQTVTAYAEHVGYPMADKEELHRVVKYQSLTSGWKDLELKEDFLNEIGTYAYRLAEQEGLDADQLEEAVAEAEGLTVSQFASRLGYPGPGRGPRDSLMVLANLPLPIYVTTSPFTFVEGALQRADKKPRSELCRWHLGLDNVPSVFSGSNLAPNEEECEHNRQGGVYQPCEHKPLVYHLYGLDAYPDSLVLTEDDYLTFLMTVSQGRGKDRGVDPIHDVVKGALQSSVLLLLGFGLSSWSFRALYWGLMKPMPDAKRYQRFCVQLTPNEQEKLYLERYLRQDARFDEVYWEPVEAFVQRELGAAL